MKSRKLIVSCILIAFVIFIGVYKVVKGQYDISAEYTALQWILGLYVFGNLGEHLKGKVDIGKK